MFSQRTFEIIVRPLDVGRALAGSEAGVPCTRCELARSAQPPPVREASTLLARGPSQMISRQRQHGPHQHRCVHCSVRRCRHDRQSPPAAATSLGPWAPTWRGPPTRRQVKALQAGHSLANRVAGFQNKAFGIRGGYAASRLEPRMQ